MTVIFFISGTPTSLIFSQDSDLAPNFQIMKDCTNLGHELIPIPTMTDSMMTEMMDTTPQIIPIQVQGLQKQHLSHDDQSQLVPIQIQNPSQQMDQGGMMVSSLSNNNNNCLTGVYTLPEEPEDDAEIGDNTSM